MRHDPEAGKFGQAATRSYTYGLRIVVEIALVWFAAYDAGANGPGHLRIATGIQPELGIVAFVLIVGGIVSILPVSAVALLYTEHTGYFYTQDRIGFAKSGGSDIAFWSGFLSFVAVVYVFARFIPPEFLGPLRPIAIAIIAGYIGWTFARRIARRVFTSLYGPKRFDPFRKV